MRSATFIRRRTVQVPGCTALRSLRRPSRCLPRRARSHNQNKSGVERILRPRAHGRRTKVCHDPWVSTVSQNCPETCKAAQEHDEHEVATWSCVLRPCSRTLAKVSYNPRVSQFPGTAWPHTFQHQAL